MLEKPISPLAPAHDRGHDGAPFQGEGAEGLRPARQDLRGLPRPVAGHRDRARTFAAFSLHMAQQQISAGSINAAVAALRFFFNVTLERPDLVRHLTTVNTPCRAPVVLSREEVARHLLEAAPGLKVKAALSVAYGAGLRRVRGRGAEGVRHRQRAHDASGRAGQGAAGSLRHALPAAARTVARMVAVGTAAGLAVSGPEPGQSNVGPAAQPRRARRARTWPESPSACRCTRCGTASRRICSNRASIFA